MFQLLTKMSSFLWIISSYCFVMPIMVMPHLLHGIKHSLDNLLWHGLEHYDCENVVYKWYPTLASTIIYTIHYIVDWEIHCLTIKLEALLTCLCHGVVHDKFKTCAHRSCNANTWFLLFGNHVTYVFCPLYPQI